MEREGFSRAGAIVPDVFARLKPSRSSGSDLLLFLVEDREAAVDQIRGSRYVVAVA
jgi:hypothetical protein